MTPPAADLESPTGDEALFEQLCGIDTDFLPVTSEAWGSWRGVAGEHLVFSAPHEVAQVRDGQPKLAEPGTGRLALAAATLLGAGGISTALSQTADPNWDREHPYIYAVGSLAPATAAVIDLHMMLPRGIDVCVGLGPDPASVDGLWQPFVESLVRRDLKVAINWPFPAGRRTVTGKLQSQSRLAIQIEFSTDCFQPGTEQMRAAWCGLVEAGSHWIGRASG